MQGQEQTWPDQLVGLKNILSSLRRSLYWEPPGLWCQLIISSIRDHSVQDQVALQNLGNRCQRKDRKRMPVARRPVLTARETRVRFSGMSSCEELSATAPLALHSRSERVCFSTYKLARPARFTYLSCPRCRLRKKTFWMDLATPTR
ncbi:hypothetical protein Y1Q_0010032 [Alligator mississippiensis]|uniref:Uncharacterized protein n=1 Tax=Alligator mississippiensis TaxID=8496 RepID=A0A151P4M3_ALLMI|nr:hypothetical protein Y1Q_0010032 [Alligator mississippiensis]